MNIAFIGNYRDDQVNGVMHSGFQLAKALVSLNIHVFFYYDGPVEKKFVDKQGVQHRVFKSPLLKITISNRFKQCLRTNADKIDVYHIHSVFIPRHYTIARILSKHGFPFVITPHGGYNRLSLERTLSRHKIAKKIYIQAIEHSIVNRASGLVAVTELEVDDLRAFGASCPIRVIPNTVSSLRNSRPHSGSEIVLLFLGRYDARFKGLLFLLETFKLVTLIRKDVKLVMYGEGKDKKKLIQAVREGKIGNVEIREPIFGEEKDQALENCTAYFQPSRSEAFGMAMVEAMSFGKSVIVTDESYMSPLLRKNGVGLVIPYKPYAAANEILKYLNDRDTLKAHGLKCRALVEREFNPTRVAKATCAFYKQVQRRPAAEPAEETLDDGKSSQADFSVYAC